MTLDQISLALAAHRLTVMGAAPGAALVGAPTDTATLVLAGPGPGFWDHVTAQPEFADGTPDPLDRWSVRILGKVAEMLDARAVFPFGGPPWAPFIDWALASGSSWISPVGLLVHETAGLFVSFRGALAFRTPVALPAPTACPCETCAAQPCRTACPVAALTAQGYDVPRCRSYLETGAGQDCLNAGCAVRRACPISATAHRTAAQSRFHMQAFAR